MSALNRQLHWSQRVALVRHSLHTASRSGDFTFFKTLQASGMLEGTNHVAQLSASLGDEADAVLAAMDNLNTGLAYIHQDAFKHVFDKVKESMREESTNDGRSALYVDITMQKNMADMAIDKMTSSAIALISQQPSHVQDEAANVWISGATIVADCMEVTIRELDQLDQKLRDLIRMEESWNVVKASAIQAATGLKGVFSLMDVSGELNNQERSPSSSSYGSTVFRRLSNAFAGSSPAHSRASSVASLPANVGRRMSASPVYKTPNYVRNSVNAGCPTSMPSWNFNHHQLSAIPPTPAHDIDQADPFDTSVLEQPPVTSLPAMTMDQKAMATMTV
ncbi:hypothetical protein MBLNU230_g4167t1 [Neophaeotheca triangularis]